jgi:hypothetical protein
MSNPPTSPSGQPPVTLAFSPVVSKSGSSDVAPAAAAAAPAKDSKDSKDTKVEVKKTTDPKAKATSFPKNKIKVRV